MEKCANNTRVLSVDIHPSETWLLCALFTGRIYVWNYNTGALVNSVEVSFLPVRCAKFMIQKRWIVACSDDLYIRVYNHSTFTKISQFVAHSEYIQYIEIHPTFPFILSASSDCTIKLWALDNENGWQLKQIFSGHKMDVLMIKFNSKDKNSFASASRDKSIKMWVLDSPKRSCTLKGHSKGVNCVSYFSGHEPYLISGSDDTTVRVWDYLARNCVSVLEIHSAAVSAVCFHPFLSVIVSGSKDFNVRLYCYTTCFTRYSKSLDTTLNFELGQICDLAVSCDNKLFIGFDEGAVCAMLKLDSLNTVASLKRSSFYFFASNLQQFLQDVGIGTASNAYSVIHEVLGVKQLEDFSLLSQKDWKLLENEISGPFFYKLNKKLGLLVDLPTDLSLPLAPFGQTVLTNTTGQIQCHKTFWNSDSSIVKNPEQTLGKTLSVLKLTNTDTNDSGVEDEAFNRGARWKNVSLTGTKLAHFAYQQVPVSEKKYSLEEKEKWLDIGLFEEQKLVCNQKQLALKYIENSELQIERMIGEGSFGYVYKACWRGMKVAVKNLKSVFGAQEAFEELLYEAEVLSKVCNHHCIVQFVGITFNHTPALITQYMSNGSVEDLLVKRQQEARLGLVLRMALEAAQGVQHLHMEGVIHRDLAARNLLVDEHFHVRVSDFGFARVKTACASHVYTQSEIAPIKWTAPEALLQRKYSSSSDVFSFGVVLYEMFMRQAPWKCYSNAEVIIKVCRGERMSLHSTLDSKLTFLIQSCWAHKPHQRLTLPEIMASLNEIANSNSEQVLDTNIDIIDPNWYVVFRT